MRNCKINRYLFIVYQKVESPLGVLGALLSKPNLIKYTEVLFEQTYYRKKPKHAIYTFCDKKNLKMRRKKLILSVGSVRKVET